MSNERNLVDLDESMLSEGVRAQIASFVGNGFKREHLVVTVDGKVYFEQELAEKEAFREEMYRMHWRQKKLDELVEALGHYEHCDASTLIKTLRRAEKLCLMNEFSKLEPLLSEILERDESARVKAVAAELLSVAGRPLGDQLQLAARDLLASADPDDRVTAIEALSMTGKAAIAFDALLPLIRGEDAGERSGALRALALGSELSPIRGRELLDALAAHPPRIGQRDFDVAIDLLAGIDEPVVSRLSSFVLDAIASVGSYTTRGDSRGKYLARLPIKIVPAALRHPADVVKRLAVEFLKQANLVADLENELLLATRDVVESVREEALDCLSQLTSTNTASQATQSRLLELAKDSARSVRLRLLQVAPPSSDLERQLLCVLSEDGDSLVRLLASQRLSAANATDGKWAERLLEIWEAGTEPDLWVTQVGRILTDHYQTARLVVPRIVSRINRPPYRENRSYWSGTIASIDPDHTAVRALLSDSDPEVRESTMRGMAKAQVPPADLQQIAMEALNDESIAVRFGATKVAWQTGADVRWAIPQRMQDLAGARLYEIEFPKELTEGGIWRVSDESLRGVWNDQLMVLIEMVEGDAAVAESVRTELSGWPSDRWDMHVLRLAWRAGFPSEQIATRLEARLRSHDLEEATAAIELTYLMGSSAQSCVTRLKEVQHHDLPLLRVNAADALGNIECREAFVLSGLWMAMFEMPKDLEVAHAAAEAAGRLCPEYPDLEKAMKRVIDVPFVRGRILDLLLTEQPTEAWFDRLNRFVVDHYGDGG